jgi:hypothetical protein
MLLNTKLLIEKTSDSSLEEIDTVIDLAYVTYIRQFIEDDDTPPQYRRDTFLGLSTGDGIPIKTPYKEVYELFHKSRNPSFTKDIQQDDTPSI